MRTNIEIDDDLMSKAMQLSLLKTKKQVVEAALAEFIKATSRRKLISLRGKITWEGDLNEMRTQE